jgi:large subunit ribosomal protein L13
MKVITRSTRSIKPTEVEKQWHLIDADGLVVGRVASIVANTCAASTKSSYTPHVDCGDNIIIINADKVRCHRQQAGRQGLLSTTPVIRAASRSVTAGKILGGRFPERLMEKAVERMVPRGPLGRQQMKNLRMYAGTEHPHEAQTPERSTSPA